MTDRDAVELSWVFSHTETHRFRRSRAFDTYADKKHVPRSAEFEHVRVRCMNILKPGIGGSEKYGCSLSALAVACFWKIRRVPPA